MKKIFGKKIIKNPDMFLRSLLLIFVDILTVIVSMTGALWIRCDFSFAAIDPVFLESVYNYLYINIVCTILIYAGLHLYSSLWRFASIVELKNVIFAVILSAAMQTIGMKLLNLPVPRSFPFLYLLLLTAFTTVSRFSYRFARIALRNQVTKKKNEPIRTMIVGAGAAGYMIVREMKNSKHLNRSILCIIDDDPAKAGTYLQGIPIVGKKESIPIFADKYDIKEIVIAIPTLTQDKQKELLEICQKTSCKILILPGIYQLVNEEVTVSMLREVQIEDLLGREPVNLEMDEIMDYVQNKTVLVTGGGGSIGSEICRQIAIHNPRQLIVFDIYENNAYDIENELRKSHPELNLQVLIGSVRNQKRVERIFSTYRPELVFHAAAHKHVPLMENSPNEAVKNNVLGTWIVAQAADRYHAKKMVLISTDKAVRPTNIMGASKRICELIVQNFAQKSKTEYAAVRFGNVLGSNGSVIPLFRKQIAQGGPVTVTDPNIIRYFMTIPEAVNLVLQCGALAEGGEVFILDMGEPVKILDLAKKMIRLSGYVPDQDIKIVFTGLRPGEKLYEELLIDEDNLKETSNDRIFVAQQKAVDCDWIEEKVNRLIEHAYDEKSDIRTLVKELVPEYNYAVKTTPDREQESKSMHASEKPEGECSPGKRSDREMVSIKPEIVSQ
ncbi:MAG: polysaccharide biosynthesis protein [Lachnospiraceae bacterium]|nr:polysaccharide biosynthesis protein [Lachnospiraceae bacterium]